MKIPALIKRWFCRHEFAPPLVLNVGAWKKVNMAHPVYPDVSIPLERQEFVAVATCKTCGKKERVFGYNSRDIQTEVTKVRTSENNNRSD